MKNLEQEVILNPRCDLLSCFDAGAKLGLLLSEGSDKSVNDSEKTNEETEETSEKT